MKLFNYLLIFLLLSFPCFAQQSGGPIGGSGNVVGPSLATDNAIARFDAATGKLLQDSAITIDDYGNLSTSGSGTFGSVTIGSSYLGANGDRSYFIPSTFDWFSSLYYVKPSPTTGRPMVYNKSDDSEFDVSDLNPNTGGSQWYVRTDGNNSTCDGSEDEAAGDGTCAFLTVGKAIDSASTGDTINIGSGLFSRTGGVYDNVFGTVQEKSLSFIGTGNTIISAHPSLTWTLSDDCGGACSNTYEAARSAVLAVFDAGNVDANGDYQQLTERASVGDVESNAGSWYTDNVTVWVRMPDDNDLSSDSSDVRPFMNISAFYGYGDITLYLEGIEVHGGAAALRFRNSAASQNSTIYAKDCAFKYSVSSNAVYVYGADAIFQNCTTSYGNRDGFNYPANNGDAGNIIEIDCTSHAHGWANDAVTYNSSTSHDGYEVVRVGGEYFNSVGPVVIETGTNTVSLNIGVSSHDSNSGGSTAADANFQSASGAVQWLDQCLSYGSTYDFGSTTSGAVTYKRGGSDGNTPYLGTGLRVYPY